MKFFLVFTFIALPVFTWCTPPPTETTPPEKKCETETPTSSTCEACGGDIEIPQDCPELAKFNVVIQKEEYFQKIQKKWYVWRITKEKTEVKTDITACSYRHCSSNCKAVQVELTSDESQKLNCQMWGYDGQNLLYSKEKISYSSEKYEIFESTVETVMKAEKSSQTAVAVEKKEEIEAIYNNKFGILGSDWDKYVVFQVGSEAESTTIICVSEEIYKNQDKSSVSGFISEILKLNQIDETDFFEMTTEIDVDLSKINVGTNDDKTQTKTETQTPSNVDETKKPEDVKEFSNFNVVIRKEEHYQAIQQTWFLWKITKAATVVNTDVTTCLYRYCDGKCTAVKFQYTAAENQQLTLKMWGYDNTNLIFLQETVSYASETCEIFQTTVDNVMKAEKTSQKAVSVEKRDEIENFFKAKYAILASDWEKFVVFQSCSETDTITFVGVREEIYVKQDYSAISASVTEILNNNGIKESDLFELAGQFDVDTNLINGDDDKPLCGC